MPILGVLEAEGVFFERSSRRAEVSTGGVASPESGGASRSMALRLASLRLGRVSPVAAAGRAGGWSMEVVWKRRPWGPGQRGARN